MKSHESKKEFGKNSTIKLWILIISIVIGVLTTVSVTTKPELNHFEFTVTVNDETPDLGDEITVTATLSNHSFGLYLVDFYPPLISLLVVPTEWPEVAFLLIRKRYFILPFQTVVITKTFRMSSSGSYYLKAFCPIYFRDKTFNLNQTINIDVE